MNWELFIQDEEFVALGKYMRFLSYFIYNAPNNAERVFLASISYFKLGRIFA